MQENERLLGLDFGAKTVGVAVTDPLGITVQGVETIWRTRENKLRKTIARIETLTEEYRITGIVVGLPLHMDDSESERSKAAREFADMLEKRLQLPVIMWDERLSTYEAREILKEMEIPQTEWKDHIDQIAATLILEDYVKQNGTEKTQGKR